MKNALKSQPQTSSKSGKLVTPGRLAPLGGVGSDGCTEPAGFRAGRLLPLQCRIPSEQRECVGHRHFGAETEGRAGPPGVVLFCGRSQEVGGLLPWAVLRPGSRVWGLSLWSPQTDYNSAPGHCFQSSVSKGGLVPEPQATGEGKAGQPGLWEQLLPSEWGASTQQEPGRGADCGSSVTVQGGGRHASGPRRAARTAWTAARPSAATAASPAGAPPPPSAW